MILVPFHLGWRGLQNRRAGFESRKEPRAGARAAHARYARESASVAWGEPTGAWLPVKHNELLAAPWTADRGSPRDPGGASDARAGCRTIELFAAILPIEWG